MANVLVYYAHPGHQVSRINKAMLDVARTIAGLTLVDLYAEYPRLDIDVDLEQERLTQHDLIVFQCPLFWYSTPAIVKEWQDLVLEQGFAYGHDGNALAGKVMMFALTAAGPQAAYTSDGYQHFDLRTFLTPLEQTARLCKMRFAAPYVLFDALREVDGDGAGAQLEHHAAGWGQILTALRDDQYDFDLADTRGVVGFADLPITEALANG